MTTPDNSGPSIGGADLECLMAFPHLSVSDVTGFCGELRFLTPSPVDAVVLTDIDYSFYETSDVRSVDQILDLLAQSSASIIITNLQGKLFDIDTRISVSYFLLFGVMSLSTPESFLWGFSENPSAAVFQRLDAFYHLCELVSRKRKPDYALIGS